MFEQFDLWPRVATALVLVTISVVIARFVRGFLEPRLARMRTRSFGAVFSRLIAATIVVVAVLVGLTIVFPSVNVATLLGGLGVLSIAAGFAFQDILSNLLAGILLIFRQPFVSGDQISVDDIRGTVEEITIRETKIRGYDGRMYYVPNQDVYTNAIEVQTDRPYVRTSLIVGVGYGTDLGVARDLAASVLRSTDGVLEDPAPEAYFVGFGSSSMDLDLRYWTDSHQADIRRVQDAVVRGVYDAFNEADIELPYNVVTLDAYDTFKEAMAEAGAKR